MCVESGCQAACCRNISGQMATTKEFFLNAFPMAELVDSPNTVIQKIVNHEEGVYYSILNNWWISFAISGVCPNLDSNFNCRIHESRYYQNVCKNMKNGSEDCIRAMEISRSGILQEV